MKIMKIFYICLLALSILFVTAMSFLGQGTSTNGLRLFLVMGFLAMLLLMYALFDVTYKALQRYTYKDQDIVPDRDNFKALLNVMPDILFIFDEDGNFVDYQSSDDSKHLLKKEELIGKNMAEVISPEITKKSMLAIRNTLDNGIMQEFECSLSIDDAVWDFEARMIKHSERTVLAVVRDITDSKKKRLLIEELSYKDPLTKTFNRRYFDESMLTMDKEVFLPLGMIMIDVNGLKLTNDAFGHLAGDLLLIEIAKVLSTVKLHSKVDYVARIGGDEFVIVCPLINEEEVQEIIQRIQKKLKNTEVNGMPISMSLGWGIRKSLNHSWQETFIQAENAMYRMKLTESKRIRNQIIKNVMKTLTSSNAIEKKHSEGVSAISRKIAQLMALSDETVAKVEKAGLYHDIGKIAIRRDYLDKPEKLTQKEFDEVKQHAESGYQLLRSVDAYANISDIVLSHHERVDGLGYPRGLKGNEISIESRIIMVADAYEAMRSDRPYRKGVSHGEAIKELIIGAGTQFDQSIVDVFIDKYRDDRHAAEQIK